MRWHYTTLAAARIDPFYVLSSTVFLLTFAIAGIANRGSSSAEMRLFVGLGGLLLALSVAILILISVSFDFGTSNYPSRQFPFLPCGRYLMGSLVPFLIMYLGGLEVLLSWLQLRFFRLPLLILIVISMFIAEIAYSMGVFASQYNWYHLP